MRRLLLFALLLIVAPTVAFATDVAAGGWTPRPVFPKGQGDHCVEPTEVMRRLHGEIVRPPDGTPSSRGLPHHDLAGCVACHAQRDKNGAYIPVNAKGQFCESCHRFSAVSINCFSCHASTPEESAAEDMGAVTADHSKFEILKQPFASVSDVPAACLTCHTEAGKQLRATDHWAWSVINPRTGQALGLLHTFNMVFGSDQAQCADCHIGNEWKNGRFDFTSDKNVDCLVCHDTTGAYKRFSADAGKSPFKTIESSKGGADVQEAVNLSFVAQHVGKTSRETCGSCHFNADGGDGLKHGDLDASLENPKRTLDIHMGVDGLNFTCSTCHVAEGHVFTPTFYTMAAKETHGINVPGHDNSSRATCESCHGFKPHRPSPHKPAIYAKLNEHTEKVACETCHIPSYARGGVPTKTAVDWSTAGKKGPDVKPLQIDDSQGRAIYTTETGGSTRGENLIPHYAWFDGEIRYARLGERIDPGKPVALNTFEGSAMDPNARVWPFKVMRGKLPYDAGKRTLAVAHLFGDDDAAGADYSGAHGFVDATMSLPLAHTVAPIEQALQCGDCHRSDGRLAGINGVYMPGRDRNHPLDWLGWLGVGAAVAGVSAHGVARVAFARRRRQNP